MSLRISLLGPPQLSQDDQLIELPGYRPLALLAYLLITSKPQSREHLVDLLFDRPGDPRAALRWTLSKLRKTLGPESIKADRREISFNFENDYWFDVYSFETGDLEHYRGDLLEGLNLRDARKYDAWLLVERERLRATYQIGLELQLREQKREGESTAVEHTARQLLRLDNLREDWHCDLMSAYAQQGKFESALAQYDLCCQFLREELGEEPAVETQALAQLIENEQSDLYRVLASRSNFASTLAESLAKPIEQQRAITQQKSAEEEAVQSPLTRISTWKQIALIGAAVLILFLIAGVISIINKQESNSTVAAESDIEGEPALVRGFAGTNVTIGGPFSQDSKDVFAKSLLPFEEKTGIDIKIIQYQDDFEPILGKVIDSGLSPDIIQFPQPGFLAQFVQQGKVIDVRTFLDDDYLLQQYGEALLEAAIIEDQMAGIWHASNVKSLVWYPRQEFEEAGYEVPETWDELMALSDQIIADGKTPWCIGIENRDATGWVGTDWVEDILLRTAPPEAYDAWVAGELPFDSPEIRRVFAIMDGIWLEDAYVFGGTESITSESLLESPMHLVENPPGCYLHRQASFIISIFPEELTFGQDYDFFYLPPIDAEFGNPVLGGGDIMAMFDDRPEVREVMRYLTTGESVRPFVEAGVHISPHRDAPFEWYTHPAHLKIAQVLYSADTYRFDGSDLMPAVVGTETFWQGIVDWANGADLDTVLQDIDRSWPKKK